MKTQPHLHLLQGFLRLRASGDHGDVTITCQGQEFVAHRSLLSAQSEYFQKMFGGCFLEAKENKVAMDDDEPQVIESLIEYCYHCEYIPTTTSMSEVHGEVADIVFDVKVYVAADRYLIVPLKSQALMKFEVHAEEHWNTTAFAEAVAEIYATTASGDSPIKERALSIIRKHAAELLNKKNKHHASFLKVLYEREALAADILTSLDVPCGLPTYLCHHCGESYVFPTAGAERLHCVYCGEYEAVQQY